MDIGKKLTELRHAAGYSQQEAAALLSKHVSPITNRAVSKWETGVSLPDAEQFIWLCEIYGVADVITEFLGFGSDSPYSGLNRDGILMAKELIRLLRLSDRFKEEPQQEPSLAPAVKRTVPLYDMSVSTGTGIFLDSDNYGSYEGFDVPPSADFAVRIYGSAMEPEYKNGSIAFVQSAPQLEHGETGIFIFNGDAYCRVMDRSNGVRLIALNDRFAPIRINHSYELRTVGRVVKE